MVLSSLDSNVIGKYHLIAQLGQGGMATVHLAVAHGLPGFQKLIVVKVLRPDAAMDNQELCQMFLAEARLSARMQHPNVVQTLEAGEADGRVYLVMEYLDGQPLNLLFRRAKTKPGLWSQAVHIRILAEALRGLHYAHELRDFDGTPLGLVHRDVSPHNVFVTYDGQIKLVDFGVAKLAVSEEHTQTGILKGKIGYMPPEQIEGKPLDRRADIFAAGVMLFEALSCERMWQGDSDPVIFRKLLLRQIPDIHKAAPRAPRRLRDACAKALAIDPAERFRTAAELQRELENWLETSGTRTTTRQVGRTALVLFERERQEVRTIVERRLKALTEGIQEAAPLPLLLKPAPGTGSVQLSHLARLAMPRSSGRPPASLAPSTWTTGAVAAAPVPNLVRPPAKSDAPGSTSAVSLLPDALTEIANDQKSRAGRIAKSSARIAVLGTTLLMAGLIGLMRTFGIQSGTSLASVDPSASSAEPSLAASAAPSPPPAEPARSVTLTLRAVPSSAVWSLDGVVLPKNPYSLTVPISTTPKRLRLEASGHVPFERDVVPDRDMNFDTVLEVRPRRHRPAIDPASDSADAHAQNPPSSSSATGSAPARRSAHDISVETFGF